jgi:hypothetical protein
MVYDEAMIKRMIQLLNNEYQEDEIDRLVNRQMALFSQNSGFERRTMRRMMVDTSKIFIFIQDSLNKYRDKAQHPELYQNFDVFKYMQLDTTARFRYILDNVIKSERENVINDYLTQYHFDIHGIIRSCVLIQDERLVETLVNLLNKLTKRTEELIQMLQEREKSGNNDEKWKLNDAKTNNENIIESIKTTLARLHIEPYYSDYLKSITLPLEEIKAMRFGWYIETLSEVLQTQEAFLEISKYLHSSAFTTLTGDGELLGKAYVDAYREIKKYIKNRELWKVINKPDFNLEKDRFEIYNWMQKNYGKYEIKRIW